MNNTPLESMYALGAPLLTILLGVVVLLLDLGSRRSPATRRVLPLLSIVGLIVVALASVANAMGEGGWQTGAGIANFFAQSMIMDSAGALFCLLLAVVAALAIGMAPAYLEEKRINQGEFYALTLWSTAGAMLMATAHDLVNVFVGLEILSVALYILAGFARREARSEESAVKYFLLGAFASGFLLYGTALIYGAVGLALQNTEDGQLSGGPASYTNFGVIMDLLRQTATTAAPLATSPLFIAGVGLLIVGLGFKAAIVPFHSYAPDVYEGAPTPVTAFMSVAAKAGAFAALIRLFQVLTETQGVGPYRVMLWVLAAATMIVGNILAVRQTNIKRMLAYSSIAHAGYILVGILASANPYANSMVVEAARDSVRFYLLAYTFMNIGAFAVVVWLGRDGGEYRDIRSYAGLGKRQPLAAAVLSIFLLSLAGIPLTAGFLGKLYLFLTAIRAGETALAVVGLVVSAIGVFYYLGVIVQMYFRDPEHEFAAPRAGGAKNVALICAALTILFGVTSFDKIGPTNPTPPASRRQPVRAIEPAQPTESIAVPVPEATPSPQASDAQPSSEAAGGAPGITSAVALPDSATPAPAPTPPPGPAILVRPRPFTTPKVPAIAPPRNPRPLLTPTPEPLQPIR